MLKHYRSHLTDPEYGTLTEWVIANFRASPRCSTGFKSLSDDEVVSVREECINFFLDGPLFREISERISLLVQY